MLEWIPRRAGGRVSIWAHLSAVGGTWWYLGVAGGTRRRLEAPPRWRWGREENRASNASLDNGARSSGKHSHGPAYACTDNGLEFHADSYFHRDQQLGG